jgi:hypothetical protein
MPLAGSDNQTRCTGTRTRSPEFVRGMMVRLWCRSGAAKIFVLEKLVFPTEPEPTEEVAGYGNGQAGRN